MVTSVLLVALLAGPHALRGQDTAQIQEHTANAERALLADDLVGDEREYRALLASNPENSEAWTGLGVLLYGSGKAQQTAAALDKALKIDHFHNI